MTSASPAASSTATPADPLAGRQAPHSVEAEQGVISAILNGPPDAALRAVELLEEWMFASRSHRAIFRTITALTKSNTPVDPITLREALQRAGELETSGGIEYLAYLLDVVPTAANLESHCRIVRDKALLRRLIEIGTEIVQDAFEGGKQAVEVLDRAERKIFEIGQARSVQGFERLKNLLWPTMERIEALHGRADSITGVPSGFIELDQKTAGFQKGDLVIVAARPSMGKTAFVLNVALHAAIEARVGVALFSLEMSRESLVQRMLTSEARVDAHRLRTGTLRDADYKLIATAAGVLNSAPIWIDDSAALTPLELRSRARRIKIEEDVGLVVVDYLQLMREPEYSENRVQEISAISRSLKALAKELNVPVIALSQLSRAPEQRGGESRRPQLSDLRESGAIEQDADVVLFIYRPEMYAKDELEREELRGQAEVIVGKQRNGPTGTVKLYFHSAYTRFDNYSTREADAPAAVADDS
ncbi:MAG TPA: replicative DNA helicase [Gemmatimonadales bacterium]|nr:replicative DNA helicase [Gemmatimonadales bacterium]